MSKKDCKKLKKDVSIIFITAVRKLFKKRVGRSAGHETKPGEDDADTGDADSGPLGPQDGRDTIVDEDRVQFPLALFRTRKKGI